jgi:transcriptional regulator GlxA family with amidase domain
VFRQKVGVAPGRYVEQCRLERARQYLEGTDEQL